MIIIFSFFLYQVSFVSEHIGTQDANPKSADFDDDDGNGLVS